MEPSDQKRGPSDATDYSASKAPETAKEAENRPHTPSDPRLIPGGEQGAPEDTGMSSLERPISPLKDE
jgi:hypothetical protein